VIINLRFDPTKREYEPDLLFSLSAANYYNSQQVPASLTPTPKINTTQNDQLNILFLQGVGVEKDQKGGRRASF